jgi:hypothetical protein
VTILNYSWTRLQIGAVLFTLSACLVVARFWLVSSINNGRTLRSATADVQLDWVMPVMFLFAASVVGRMLYLMSGDLAAIKALPEGLQVTSFFSRRVIAWEGLIGGHRVNYGNFLHRNRWFNLRYMVAGAYRAARVPLILTKRPSGGQMSLPEKIDQARDEALGRPCTPGGERLPGTGIDPDAAIARYLKAKAEAAAAVPPAPQPAAAEANAPPLVRARPAFGRKGLS